MSEHTWTFANPWALLLLAVLPLLALLHSGRGAAPAVVYSSLEPFRSVGRIRRSRTGGFLLGLLLASLALLIVALARPQREREVSRAEASGIDIMLALDISPSMLAEDFTIGGQPANRLEAVKQVTEGFISGRPSDRIGITAFSGKPALISPLTLDHGWLLQNLERLQVGIVEPGTAIGSAIASAAARLKDRTQSKSRIIVLLTDGDNNAGNIAPNTAAEAARALGIKIYTICAGSRGVVKMPARTASGMQVWVDQEVVVDEEALREIARIGNGQFYRATDSKSLERIFREIDQLEKTTVETSRTREYDDLFPWFVAAGAALLGAGMVLGETIWRKMP
jgi:Ca-activated chloride channel homolog